MKRITVSLEQKQLDTLNEIQEEENISSRSESLRRFFRKYERFESLEQKYESSMQEYEDTVDMIKDRHQKGISELESEIDELKDNLALERQKTKQVLSQRDENKELVRYVQQERTQEQRWREASIMKRLKWKVFGIDSTENND